MIHCARLQVIAAERCEIHRLLPLVVATDIEDVVLCFKTTYPSVDGAVGDLGASRFDGGESFHAGSACLPSASGSVKLYHKALSRCVLSGKSASRAVVKGEVAHAIEDNAVACHLQVIPLHYAGLILVGEAASVKSRPLWLQLLVEASEKNTLVAVGSAVSVGAHSDIIACGDAFHKTRQHYFVAVPRKLGH